VDEFEDQPSTGPAPAADTTTLPAETNKTEARGPTWRPTSPDDQPPQKLIDAKLAYDRQRMERTLDHLQIHDPALRRRMRETMIDKRRYDARRHEDACRGDEPPTNALECGLSQGWEMLRHADADSGFLRKHDVHKPFRDMLLAVEAYRAGSLEPLRALRGEAPNKTNAADPADAMVRAVLVFCVRKLTIGSTKTGGLTVTEAARHVSDYATAQGLPRTPLTVRKIYYTVLDGSDKGAADWYASIAADSFQDGDTNLSRKDRLAWLQRMTIFGKLPESHPIPIPE
jgi:hypothetical protein